MKTDNKMEVNFHPNVNHQVVVKNVKNWHQSHVKQLVRNVKGPGERAKQFACQHGLMASMDDAFNKVAVRARA